MIWILAFLGIATSFLLKYAKRTNKKVAPSFKYWLTDNWSETIASVTATIILVIIFKESTFDDKIITEKFPWIESLPMDLIAAAVAGYLNNTLFYAIIKKVKGK